MNRRALLSVGGSGLAASLSGCLSSLPFGGGPPEVREASGPAPARLQPAVPSLHADSTRATLVVGDEGDRDEQVWVWNETGEKRTVSIEIGGSAGAEPWFRERYDLAAGANLAIDLREKRDYAIRVSVGDRTKTVEYPESRFDCNATATDVVIRDGKFEVASIQTTEGCGGGLW
ncbi:hypothetical protein M0R88_03740 [Halorussus gelatinilyticus]|uniref:Uncharacterized protein n=1 Tax=Halorussus gelatinilyticus TaxID=2937524 RepID=A0A8U0IJK8_9EURY|nr:hypothetical protein [Halorussus gelatinilyticus]UPW01223.1 hypothetical protein M0R88_03740 [Halorussus gelatinilyticus]